jgi:hypothetical protein
MHPRFAMRPAGLLIGLTQVGGLEGCKPSKSILSSRSERQSAHYGWKEGFVGQVAPAPHPLRKPYML